MTTAVDTTPTWTSDQTGGYAMRGFAITPSDANELAFVVNKLYVGGAGNITLVMADDTASVQLLAVPVGTVLDDFRIRHILATGTSATGLVGFY